MKRKIIITCSILLIVMLLGGCTETKNNVSKEQQDALNNCIEYIKNSSFDSKDRIDISVVSVKVLTEDMEDSVWVVVDRIEDYFEVEQPEHWVFTIGDTSGHDFAIMVCNSETSDVIGYIPIS